MNVNKYAWELTCQKKNVNLHIYNKNYEMNIIKQYTKPLSVYTLQ